MVRARGTQDGATAATAAAAARLSGVLDVIAFAALGWESAAVRAALRRVVPQAEARTWRGVVDDGGEALVVQTGVGDSRAADAAARAPLARRFVMAGCAGGLAPGLRAGTVVVASTLLRLGDDGTVLEELPLAATGRLPAGAVRAPIAVTPTPLGAAVAKAAAARTGAVAVEMESTGVARVAAARGIPCTVVRVVLDEAGDALPMVEGLVDPATGDTDALRAVWALARRPGLWPAIARLARRQRIADAALRTATRIVLRGS